MKHKHLAPSNKRRMAALALAALLCLALTPGLFSVAAPVASSDYRDLTAKVQLGSPSDILRQADGSYLIVDQLYKVIWKLAPGESLTTASEPYVGRIGAPDAAGVPLGGYNDAEYASAAFALPWDIVPFMEGYLVSDSANHVVRYVASGRVKTAAGTGKPSYQNGVSTQAGLSYPTGLAADTLGTTVYIADTHNNMIRSIDTKGNVIRVAGATEEGYRDGSADAARFNSPTALAWFEGDLYIADTGNHCIRKLDMATMQVTTVAGLVCTDKEEVEYYAGDYLDGPAETAKFSSPMGLSFSADGTLFISDSGNGAIRRLANGVVSTLLKGEASEGDVFPVDPRGLITDGKEWLICDPFAGVVFSPFAPFTDTIPTWAQDAVAFTRGTGIMVGNADGSFGVNGRLTRGQAARILYNMYSETNAAVESSEINHFSDVAAGKFYTEAVNWCADNGLVNGDGDGRFNPNSSITRQDLVVMLHRYAKLVDGDMTQAADLSKFKDGASVSAYAMDSLLWAVQAGVIAGDNNASINPRKSITRLETAQVLFNYLG